jgi:hypothetical protein
MRRVLRERRGKTFARHPDDVHFFTISSQAIAFDSALFAAYVAREVCWRSAEDAVKFKFAACDPEC